MKGSPVARDRVLLEGMVFYGYHGANPAERTLGQRFIVDLEVELDLRTAGQSDDLAHTADYSAMYAAVREVVEGPPRNLLESVAEAIARRILGSFAVDAVRVRVRKPEVPIRGSVLAHAAVEIYRER